MASSAPFPLEFLDLAEHELQDVGGFYRSTEPSERPFQIPCVISSMLIISRRCSGVQKYKLCEFWRSPTLGLRQGMYLNTD